MVQKKVLKTHILPRFVPNLPLLIAAKQRKRCIITNRMGRIREGMVSGPEHPHLCARACAILQIRSAQNVQPARCDDEAGVFADEYFRFLAHATMIQADRVHTVLNDGVPIPP